MKKLLVISSYPAPYRIAVFEGLRKKYQIDVFFTTRKDQNRSAHFFVNQNESSYYVLSDKNDKKRYRKALWSIKQYDAVLAYDWYLPAALLGELWAIFHHVPYFINCDGALLENKKGFKELIKKFFVKRARCCFAGGIYAQNYFLKYGAARDHIVVHKFTSLDKDVLLSEPVAPSDKIELRKSLGLKNRKVVLSIGQFIERKGFDILLKAWGNLDSKYQLLIIGGGELENEYCQIIKKYNYSNVKLLEFVPFKEIRRYYMASDLFVLPTREDIWGLVINEAMAYGLPVISTDRCVAALELINQGENGSIVKVDDINDLHYQMELYLNSDEVSRKIGLKNIDKIKEYTLENIVNAHLKAFSDML